MNYHKNEKGFALLIVLLTITIISSVSAVLASKTISSAKQVKSADSYVRLIDLAEMGTTYTSKAIEKSLTENIAKQLDGSTVKEDLDDDGEISDYEKTTYENYLDSVVNKAAIEVESEVSTPSDGVEVDGHSKYSVNVEKETASHSGVKFKVESTGYNKKHKYPIIYNVNATISDLGTVEVPDSNHEIETVSCDPTGNSDLVENDYFIEQKEFADARAKVNDSTFDYEENDNNNIKLESETIGACVNYKRGFTVKNGETVTFNGSVKATDSNIVYDNGSKVFVHGNYYAPQGLEIKNSALGVFDNFASMMKINMKNGSEVWAGDNLEIYDSLNMDSDSTLTVTKSLFTQNYSDSKDTNVYVGGNWISSSNFSHKGGNIVVNGDFSAPNINMDGGDMTIYGDFNPSGNFNMNGGKVVVYGDITNETYLNNNYNANNLFSSKIIKFDKLSELDSLINTYGERKVYYYTGDEEIEKPTVPSRPINPNEPIDSGGDIGGSDVGEDDTESEIDFEHGNVNYMGQQEK